MNRRDFLKAGAAGLAALNFGLSDKTLAESILALENADYNALLAQAQQLDAAQGDDVHELAKAVGACAAPGTCSPKCQRTTA